MERLPTEPDACLRLDDQLCFALYSASSAIMRTYRPLLTDLGLTYPQYVVLMALWEGDDISVSELGTRLATPMNGLTPVLDRLERAELVERRRGRTDRRVVQVSLTDAGRALEQPAAVAAHAVRCQTELSRSEVDALRVQLRELTRVLDQV